MRVKVEVTFTVEVNNNDAIGAMRAKVAPNLDDGARYVARDLIDALTNADAIDSALNRSNEIVLHPQSTIDVDGVYVYDVGPVLCDACGANAGGENILGADSTQGVFCDQCLIDACRLSVAHEVINKLMAPDARYGRIVECDNAAICESSRNGTQYIDLTSSGYDELYGNNVAGQREVMGVVAGMIVQYINHTT